MAIHPQPVEVHAWLILEHERFGPEGREVLLGALINGGGVRIRTVGQLELRSRDAKERQRIAVGKRPRFVGADHVVGNGGNARRVGRLGTQRTEGMERRHPFKVTRRDWGHGDWD